jgi:hypothetical protein
VIVAIPPPAHVSSGIKFTGPRVLGAYWVVFQCSLSSRLKEINLSKIVGEWICSQCTSNTNKNISSSEITWYVSTGHACMYSYADFTHTHTHTHTHTSESCIQSLKSSIHFITQILILHIDASKKNVIKLKWYPLLFLFSIFTIVINWVLVLVCLSAQNSFWSSTPTITSWLNSTMSHGACHQMYCIL